MVPGSSKSGSVRSRPAIKVLESALGQPLPDSEREIWQRMSPDHRSNAIQRLNVIQRFSSESGEYPAVRAASDAGVSVNRFYQMVRAWREKPSLGSLGTYASATRGRLKTPPVSRRALMEEASRVVAAHKGEQIETMLRSWLSTTRLEAATMPSRSTLRGYLAEAVRNARVVGLAGYEVRFDLSATSLIDHAGMPHVAFLAIDRGTRLILGFVLGDPEDSARVYRRLAADCLARLSQFPAGMWAERLERSELVPGSDLTRVERFVEKLDGVDAPHRPQLLRSPNRFGRYIRDDIGLKLGPIQIRPARTLSSVPSQDTPRLNAEDAAGRIELEILAHNATRIPELRTDGARNCPDSLEFLLHGLAG